MSETVTGIQHRFTAPASSDRPRLGASATVSYNPHNPAEAHDVSADGASWAAPFIIGIFIVSSVGLMWLWVSWLLIRQRKRTAKTDAI